MVRNNVNEKTETYKNPKNLSRAQSQILPLKPNNKARLRHPTTDIRIPYSKQSRTNPITNPTKRQQHCGFSPAPEKRETVLPLYTKHHIYSDGQHRTTTHKQIALIQKQQTKSKKSPSKFPAKRKRINPENPTNLPDKSPNPNQPPTTYPAQPLHNRWIPSTKEYIKVMNVQKA